MSRDRLVDVPLQGRHSLLFFDSASLIVGNAKPAQYLTEVVGLH